MFRLTRKAQTTAEYAIVIGLVIAAVLAMQVYVKRGLQGRVKDAVDHTDPSDTITGVTGQYEPYYTQSTMDSNQGAVDTETTTDGGAVGRVSNADASRTGTQQVTDVVNE